MAHVFQLLTVFESIAPPDAFEAYPARVFRVPTRRDALAPRQPALALVEIDEARRLDPGNPNDDSLYLEILPAQRLDRERSVRPRHAGLESRRSRPGYWPSVFTSWRRSAEPCLMMEPFVRLPMRFSSWCERFDHAPGREQVRASRTLALVQFNRGLILLRLGQFGRSATLSCPGAQPPIRTTPRSVRRSDWTSFDPRAREIAAAASMPGRSPL